MATTPEQLAYKHGISIAAAKRLLRSMAAGKGRRRKQTRHVGAQTAFLNAACGRHNCGGRATKGS
jgi:hypothetical protein